MEKDIISQILENINDLTWWDNDIQKWTLDDEAHAKLVNLIISLKGEM